MANYTNPYPKRIKAKLLNSKIKLDVAGYGKSIMVPGAGIEPARLLSRKILSLVCLPISPPGH